MLPLLNTSLPPSVWQQFRAQNSQIQSQLDAKIEGLEDKFTDTSNVVEYDMKKLQDKYLKSTVK